MSQVEDIILRYSRRGMDQLRDALPPDFCRRAAASMLAWSRGPVLLATGFYVDGYAETDGPAGTLVLARALRALGFAPHVVTDRYCGGYFEPEGLPVAYLDPKAGRATYMALLAETAPVGLVSVERCGATEGEEYLNMRGMSIKTHSARLDLLFDLAYGRLPTVGIGDGGNEIGMGNLAEPIRQRLGLVPCCTRVDHLVIATVSNWGAYGLAACLGQFAGRPLLMPLVEIRAFLQRTVTLGSVDGVLDRRAVSVDGFDPAVEEEIYTALRRLERSRPSLKDGL